MVKTYLPTSWHRLIWIKGWISDKHFIHDSTKRPPRKVSNNTIITYLTKNKLQTRKTCLIYKPITFHSISFLQQNLWGNIVRCTNRRVSLKYYNIWMFKKILICKAKQAFQNELSRKKMWACGLSRISKATNSYKP